MPIHDWSTVDAAIFHDFHLVWIAALQNALNYRRLPDNYYVLIEQHKDKAFKDLLTLRDHHSTSGNSDDPLPPVPHPSDSDGIAVAEAPPRTKHKLVLEPTDVAFRRTLAVRHISGHRLVAMIEIVSPGNKDRAKSVQSFAEKVASALDHGVHVLLVDLLPPGPFDPQGMHGAILRELRPAAARDLPTSQPLTLASYVAAPHIEIYLEHVAIRDPIPDMPLFFHRERYITAPLASTYDAAYRGMPSFWRETLEKRPTES